mmetsp:Transcript_17977/g.30596  ORF Transcript_17977/g.30596 Transcript_17977/m.30596 type:complete len:123 (-) Transcript_17977:98-466(-)
MRTSPSLSLLLSVVMLLSQVEGTPGSLCTAQLTYPVSHAECLDGECCGSVTKMADASLPSDDITNAGVDGDGPYCNVSYNKTLMIVADSKYYDFTCYSDSASRLGLFQLVTLLASSLALGLN